MGGGRGINSLAPLNYTNIIESVSKFKIYTQEDKELIDIIHRWM